MEKNKAKIRIAFWIITIAAGMAVGMCCAALSLPLEAQLLVTGVFAVVVFISIMVINQLWYREFMKSVRGLMPILTEENDPDRFIAENEKMLVGKKSAQIQAILRVNLCNGYCAKKEYRVAQEQLEMIDEKKLVGIQRVIYWADCAYVAFYLGESEKALGYLAKNNREIDRLEGNRELGGLIAVLHLFELIAQNEPETAQALYSRFREQWENAGNREDFDHLQALLWPEIEPPSVLDCHAVPESNGFHRHF